MIIIFHNKQIIDSYFKDIEKKHHHIIATDTCINKFIIHGGSTKRTWSGKDLTKTKIVLFPLNLSGAHWTLLVIIFLTEYLTIRTPAITINNNIENINNHGDKFK